MGWGDFSRKMKLLVCGAERCFKYKLNLRIEKKNFPWGGKSNFTGGESNHTDERKRKILESFYEKTTGLVFIWSVSNFYQFPSGTGFFKAVSFSEWNG